MKEDLKKLIDQSQDVYIPIPVNEEEMAENRLVKKEVLESRLLDDMETLDNWMLISTYSKTLPDSLRDLNDLEDSVEIEPAPTMELSEERSVMGKHSLKFSTPTNLPGLNPKNPGRIYATPSVRRIFDGEDWREWNRLSAWIYVEAPGIKSLTLRMQLYNEGERMIPDAWERDGHHNMNLDPGKWNHVVLEMPYLIRDKVTGVGFEYDMVGHENDAVDRVDWYIDKLELQKVESDVYEGWIPAHDRISFSHEGYQPGGVKIAIASAIEGDKFKVIETKTGKVVLEKPIDNQNTYLGSLQIMDFTEIQDEGEYIIVAGDHSTRVFSISNDVWEASVWKVLNFFLVQRCGYEVYGKHRYCHSDLRMVLGDKSIVANGGWHDAADLAQGFNNTTEGTQALLSLALSLKDRGRDRLYKRVLEEAKWGLDYVLKMRFEGGYRATYSSSSIWSDGVIGTEDDIVMNPARSAYSNFNAAYAEALGALIFKDIDPDYSRYCTKIAKDDFYWANEIANEIREQRGDENPETQHHVTDAMDVQVYSIGALAAAKLYEYTGDEEYKKYAKEYINIVIGCQEQEIQDLDIPMVGYFYQDLDRDLIWHHSHMAYSQLPDLSLRTMCEVFPEDEDYKEWYGALALSGEYYKALSCITFPYGVVAAGLYHEDEAKDLPEKTFASHIWAGPEYTDYYSQQVQEGFSLGKGYYIRVYPVWFSFRGNYNVLLSQNKAMTSAASVRNDYGLYAASQYNYEWIIGKNPMAQSTMIGAGYDYIQHYAVQNGQTTGSLTVGMQSKYEKDEPFWPQVCTATYKEAWICPPTKWMWSMADSLLPAKLRGYMEVLDEKVELKSSLSDKVYYLSPHEETGYIAEELPAGIYDLSYGGITREISLISGNTYRLDGPLYDLKIDSHNEDGLVTLELSLEGSLDLPIDLRVSNVEGLDIKTTIEIKDGKGSLSLSGRIIDPNKPYVGTLVPNNNFDDRREILDERL